MDKGRSFISEEELRERRKKKGALPLAVFLSFNDRDVHPHCPNASNPYHKCGRHCLDKIPSSKLLDGENSGGSRTEREKISDRWGECLSCPFASNPLHKCAYYCFEKMMDNCRVVRKEPEKGKEGATVADKRDVNPNSELVSFGDALKDHPEEEPVPVMKTRGEKIFLTADKQFNSECKNASNPFHVCAEYCFQKAPERDHPGQVAKLKRLKEKKHAFINGDITGVNPQCKYASNPFHRCAEHCFQNVVDKKISGGVMIKGIKRDSPNERKENYPIIQKNSLDTKYVEVYNSSHNYESSKGITNGGNEESHLVLVKGEKEVEDVFIDAQPIRISVSDLFHEWAKYCSLKATEVDIK